MRFLSLACSVIIFAILSAAVFTIASGSFFTNHTAVAESTRAYVNEPYGFSFSYPSDDVLNEYAPEFISVGDAGATSTVQLADVTVEIAGASSTSYEAFVHNAAAKYCAKSEGDSSTYCDGTTRSEPFISRTNLTGDIFYLREVTAVGSTTSEREAGPFYAFNISANVPGAPFGAILIRPARFAEESNLYDMGAALAHEAADSLTISKANPNR